MKYNKEEVFVVPRLNILSIVEETRGFIKYNENYHFILKEGIFIPRQQAEIDANFKQIIPYVVIKFENKFLCYKRTKNQSEQRLHNLYSIGIGGHINPIDKDLTNTDIVRQGLERELNEELNIKLKVQPQFKGFINDDLTEVGRVHLGLLFIAVSLEENFEVKEKDKIIAHWRTIQELQDIKSCMESWSQIALLSLD